MRFHGRKMAAPFLITVLFLVYLIVFIGLILQEAAAEPLILIIGIPLVLLGIGMIYMLVARIREIRSGEEDDLDNY